MTVYIGTSGFSYHHWAEKFYPRDLKRTDYLMYYCRYFSSVELNVSFYRLPTERMLKRWYGETPDDFMFSMKGSRYITHTKNLLVGVDPVELFMGRALILGKKLGVVIWQLPPNMEKDTALLENFLKLTAKYKCRFAFEFRHKSWFVEGIYIILRKYNAALVVADSPDFPRPEVMTADFSYLRFHGGKHLYSSKYSPKEIRVWSDKIKVLAKKGDVFAYFNNDANAFAARNAMGLKGLLGLKNVQK